LAYLQINDWKYGMDRRRSQVVGVPGTLWTLENGVITRGGDIERAKKWVPVYSLPAGQTFGLATLRGQPYVFGSAASPTIPPGVQYQRLQPGASSPGAEMTAIVDAKAVDGKLYVVAEFDDGSLYHYYDGVRVTGWDTIAGTDSVPEALAIRLAEKVNAQSAVEAAAVGSIVILRARTAGVAFTVSSVSGVASTLTANAPGVQQISQVSFASAPYAAGDIWDITLNGVAYQVEGFAGGVGTFILVHKKRLYSTANSLLRYTKINTFTDWTTTTVPASDAGQINMSSESEGTEQLLAAAPYNGFVAVFSANSVRIWSLESDAEENALEQVLDNTGTLAPQSVVSYGETDVFYLDESGIRSIRARDGYDAGYVSDVGNAIDDFVRETMTAAGPTVVSRATGVIDPVDGRYMLAVSNKVFVLSFFPGSKITAWSYLSPGVTFSKMVRAGRRLMARAGDTIYVYGGLDGTTYPNANEFQTVVETPFMSANDPAALKYLQGFDIACTGDWQVEVLVDPNDTTKKVDVGVVNRVTYHLPKIKLPGHTSHIAFRFTASGAGNAKIFTAAIHYDKDESS
jgi:hypothetical protein